MLLVLVKGDSCLEPIQGGVIAAKPRGPCYKVVLCPRALPPTVSSPPRPCGINHLLFSYLFNLFLYTVSFHMADTIALVVQILKQQQNLPMNLFPSKLLSHFILSPLHSHFLNFLTFCLFLDSLQPNILPHLGQRTHDQPTHPNSSSWLH